MFEGTQQKSINKKKDQGSIPPSDCKAVFGLLLFVFVMCHCYFPDQRYHLKAFHGIFHVCNIIQFEGD